MHSVTPYSFRIHDRSLPGKKLAEKYHKLDNVRTLDLLDLINDFCTKYAQGKFTTHKDGKQKKAFAITEVQRIKRDITGYIEYGDYGVAGQLKNVKTGKEKYKKGVSDSDIYKLYFHIRVEVGKTTAVGIFHSTSGRKAKSVFEDLLNEFVKEKTKGLIVRILPLTYEKLVKEWVKKAQVKQITMRGYKPAGSMADFADTVADSTVDVIVKPKKGKSMGPLFKFMKFKGASGRNRGALESSIQQCSEIKAQVELNGNRRTFSLAPDTLPNTIVEIDEADVTMVDGLPVRTSLFTYTGALISDIYTTL